MRPNIKSMQSENGSSRSKSDCNISELARAHSRRSAASDTAEHRVLRSVKRSATDQASNFQKELCKVWEDQDRERTESTQKIQQLQMEKAEEMAKLKKVLVENEKVLGEAKELQMEISQLQQQLESFNSTMQGQVAWNDIQPALYQAHGDLVSAATQFWRSVEAIQNRELATYLPGSGVVYGAWPAQVSAQEPLVSTSLPEISGLGEYSILPQPAPTTTN
ncbi:hypothetical protein PENSUB_5156 [Penicillium subrubescens]|uniref:Uncharacterized protein n=1 Tax=Penicillium subrubescens TaxID=1316194 RepID=A0A1Q5UQZ2_9EURO|nr:hypothetical protein PENSUB_5156 [Penicillium subrubescens]